MKDRETWCAAVHGVTSDLVTEEQTTTSVLAPKILDSR